MGMLVPIPIRQLMPEIQSLVDFHAPGHMPRDPSLMAWVVLDISISAWAILMCSWG